MRCLAGVQRPRRGGAAGAVGLTGSAGAVAAAEGLRCGCCSIRQMEQIKSYIGSALFLIRSSGGGWSGAFEIHRPVGLPRKADGSAIQHIVGMEAAEAVAELVEA